MFITLEGPEGSGKTSHIPYLVEYLREKGYTVFPTREPVEPPSASRSREVIHDLKNAEMHPRTETLLYQAARAQIVEQVAFVHDWLMVKSSSQIGTPIQPSLTRVMVINKILSKCAYVDQLRYWWPGP